MQKSICLKTASILFFFITGILPASWNTKTEHTAIPIENTTEIVPLTKKQREQYLSADAYNTKVISGEYLVFKDIKGKEHTLVSHDGKIFLDGESDHPFIITLFSTWCPPCRGQLPYLDDIYVQYTPKLSVLGLVVNDDNNKTKLDHFLSALHIHFPVSFSQKAADMIIRHLKLKKNYPIPLTVLYKNGYTIIHYEGATPPEMIKHDIEILKD